MNQRETTHAERVQIVERHLAGETLRAIAADMGLNYYTVRKWWRIYKKDGWSGLNPKPKGPPEVGILGTFSPLVKYVLLRLKRTHPGWGIDRLLLQMSRRRSLKDKPLPKRSAAAEYLAQFGNRLRKKRRRPTKRPKTTQPRVNEPHQCWQMDFKGEEKVDGCQVVVSPFMVCDEGSGAALASVMHAVKAKGQRTGLTVRDVQQDLRKVFAQWGLPDAIRMDRDPLFVGSTRLDWPGTLLLWLVGLDVNPVINRAFRPTDNAIVERNHWTWEQHVLLGRSYPDLEAVQQETDQDLLDRRNHLPSRHAGCDGRPPAEAFPMLNAPRRSYTIVQEAELFDLARVDRYLSEWEWRRTVDSSGKISLADRNHRVGRAYRGQVVKVSFDPQTREFVCSDVTGRELVRLVVPEVSQAYILEIAQHDNQPMGTT